MNKKLSKEELIELVGKIMYAQGTEEEIEGGDQIILLDMLSAPKSSSKEDVQRNIYRIDKNGKIIWQLLPYDAFEISTFTNVYFSEKFELLGYNFDGGEYEIDINTGKVKPKHLTTGQNVSAN